MFDREQKLSTTKLDVVQYMILIVFLVLGFRLWHLQVSGKEKYDVLAERNRIREVPILAPRGKIRDREGRVIVDNYPSFSAFLLRDQVKDVEADLPQIASGLHMTVEEIRERMRRKLSKPSYEPIILKEDLTPDELAFIEGHRNELPELETIMAHRRLYPKNGFMAHLAGYVGEVSEADLNTEHYQYYEQGDIVGKSGIEQQYNYLLTGKDGSRRSVVNSRGKELQHLSQITPVPGKELRLTIDLDVQIAAEEALEGHNGAIVAMDPRTGEILAMVSRPTYDANDFAVRISRADWSKLVNDPAKPLLNKAIQAQLAPGSVFKIIMATAGLQEGIAQKMHVNCPGGANFYGRWFKCWVVAEHRTHGVVGISKAIYQSCDVFFYTLAERLTIARIAKYASAFGLGQRTGIDLPQEAAGVMPSEEWKIKNFKQKWYIGETISVGIGQGAVTTTPLQLARAIGAIAMGGVLRRPHLVFPDELPEQYRKVKFNEEQRIPIDPRNWEIVTDAMVGVVNPGGTAVSAHLAGIDFGGKTGSSQVVSNELRKKLGGQQFKDNGWFVGVAPRRNPEIVVSTLIEQGEHGWIAAQVTSKVVKAYVEKQRKRQVQVAQSQRPVEMAALWNASESSSDSADTLRSGRFVIKNSPPASRPATRISSARPKKMEAVPGTGNRQLVTRNQQLGNRNQELGTRTGTGNRQLATRNQQPGTRNQELGTATGNRQPGTGN
ncbi:MAG: penicillin-binding protein 2 [Acidobacteriales bacterium]|nr:penicillin-binding protein 2 [Terriglobales bacterium]